MKVIKRILRIIINLVIELAILQVYLFPWITAKEGEYNAIQYLMKIYEQGDIIPVILKDFPEVANGAVAREMFVMMPQEGLCYCIFIVVACITLAAFMNVLNLLFSLFGMPKRGIVAIAWWFSLCAMVVWYTIFNIVTMEMYVYPIVFLAAEGICFFMTSLADGLVEERKKKRRRGKRG